MHKLIGIYTYAYLVLLEILRGRLEIGNRESPNKNRGSGGPGIYIYIYMCICVFCFWLRPQSVAPRSLTVFSQYVLKHYGQYTAEQGHWPDKVTRETAPNLGFPARCPLSRPFLFWLGDSVPLLKLDKKPGKESRVPTSSKPSPTKVDKAEGENGGDLLLSSQVWSDGSIQARRFGALGCEALEEGVPRPVPGPAPGFSGVGGAPEPGAEFGIGRCLGLLHVATLGGPHIERRAVSRPSACFLVFSGDLAFYSLGWFSGWVSIKS